ncbi:hypothetical protein OOU_Y34scaffold00969g40 [Pyricularia oryzae Y34]|uniref:Uncharacterized protein n=2 Tax=Pyricularia oryzae TaxID=318829 RepID=Q2KGZ2_PYRO7|nr:hypothetical protein MGCH7_ch7g193 [Pyricularia oryzae 70-15]ELQ33355.1 hypothetical protein OOU_Y34scaffold00969g40 [Pyricularia oryzae Y34]
MSGLDSWIGGAVDGTYILGVVYPNGLCLSCHFVLSVAKASLLSLQCEVNFSQQWPAVGLPAPLMNMWKNSKDMKSKRGLGKRNTQQ